MSSVLALVPDDIAAGLSLAGIHTAVSNDAEKTAELLADALENKEHRVIIITQDHFDSFDAKLQASVRTSSLPTIIAVPLDMTWKEKGVVVEDDFVVGLIRSAVGYRLNISSQGDS